jgi:hypothetical protein
MAVRDPEAIRQRLAELRAEHRALDDAITGLEQNVYVNQLQLRRLKKRKLQLKDRMEDIIRSHRNGSGAAISA